MSNTTSLPNNTSTVPPSTQQSAIITTSTGTNATTITTTTTPPSTTISSTTISTTTISSTTITTDADNLTKKLPIILPIIGGLIIIVLIIVICICCKKKKIFRRRRKSPPILPSFTVPNFNDSPLQQDDHLQQDDPPQEEAILPPLPSKKHSPIKPVLETKESVTSVNSAYSDGYFYPCPPPPDVIQDDSLYIDMSQQLSPPKPCGNVVHKGYVNDPKNPQTNINISTIDELPSHYQNTGNAMPDMKPPVTVNEYANVKNEIRESTKRPTSVIYQNTNQLLDDHQLLDYENAPPKVIPFSVVSNENLSTNNLTPQIKPKKPLPSPRTNRNKLSLENNSPKLPRGSPTSKSSPRGSPLLFKSSPNGSPRSKSSPNRSPRSESSPRTKPEKYRGVKVM